MFVREEKKSERNKVLYILIYVSCYYLAGDRRSISRNPSPVPCLTWTLTQPVYYHLALAQCLGNEIKVTDPIDLRLVGKCFNIWEEPFSLIVWVVRESISERWDPIVYPCLLLAPIISYRTSTTHPDPCLAVGKISRGQATLFPNYQGGGGGPFSKKRHWILMGFQWGCRKNSSVTGKSLLFQFPC